MKERLKMIFDRIDIFVVCIVFGCCLTVAEVFIGTWGGFVLLFIMTSLITEVCYTLRCNEKLKIELIEIKENLKKAEKESDTAIHQIVEKNIGLSASMSYWKYCGGKDGHANTQRLITASTG